MALLEEIHPGTTMRELLEACPGAQRALFRHYHIGGCSHCGFQPDETIAGVCARNENLPVSEVIACVRASHEDDLKHLIEPSALAERLAGGAPPRLLDIRTREEFEAVRIPQATLFTQDLMQEILAGWAKDAAIVVVDHMGTRGLDAAAFLSGHGFTGVKALRGGIDAFSAEVDPELPRYTLD